MFVEFLTISKHNHKVTWIEDDLDCIIPLSCGILLFLWRMDDRLKIELPRATQRNTCNFLIIRIQFLIRVVIYILFSIFIPIHKARIEVDINLVSYLSDFRIPLEKLV